MDAERLEEEVYTIQIIDEYFKNGKLRSDEEFFRDGVDISEFADESLYNEYMDVDESGYKDYEDTIEDVMDILVSDLEIYNILYKMPQLSISNDEWDLFFDTTYEYYKSHNLDEFYFTDMVDLNRFAIAKSLVYEQESISLDTYISSLKYMESDVLYINNIKDIISIFEEIFDRKDLLDLIKNSDGSFGNYGKDFVIPDDDNMSAFSKKSYYFDTSENNIYQGDNTTEEQNNGQVIEFPKTLSKDKKKK